VVVASQPGRGAGPSAVVESGMLPERGTGSSLLGSPSRFVVRSMGLRRGRGSGVLHSEGSSELPSFRGGGPSLRRRRRGYVS
jgi:hypothetical protein